MSARLERRRRKVLQRDPTAQARIDALRKACMACENKEQILALLSDEAQTFGAPSSGSKSGNSYANS